MDSVPPKNHHGDAQNVLEIRLKIRHQLDAGRRAVRHRAEDDENDLGALQHLQELPQVTMNEIQLSQKYPYERKHQGKEGAHCKAKRGC